MTKLIVLTVEDDDPQKVGIITGEGVTLDQALALCSAAARHFQELSIQAEVARRVKENNGT